MVISVNPTPSIVDFQTLLDNAVMTMKAESQHRPKEYAALLGAKLEKKVEAILNDCAKGTPFEGSIELISGQRFPDIVANKYYGVEVKTTKSNNWKSTGSSVAEGTRVEDVERIFMLFGKMCDPIDFLCRPYEECLSEVVVTHSPRYLIDMQLKQGETIFDKINIPYDILRRREDPIGTVLDYYRKKLNADNASTWWSPKGEDMGSKAIVRMWSEIKSEERKNILSKGLCLFPEIVGDKQNKYSRFAVWLSTREGIICINVRDMFSAGGRAIITFNGRKYVIPKILAQITKNISEIKRVLKILDSSELKEYWDNHDDSRDLYDTWTDMIVNNAQGELKNFPLKEYLYSI